MSSTQPLVSVWMICFNHEKYIREALDSVFSQKVDFEFEVVIGDDCSTDGTRSIILEFDKKYPGRITKLFHPENIGMIANQNAVFAACRGNYIAMLEGDDYWTDPEKLRIQIEAMLRHPECRMSFHPCRESKHGWRKSWFGKKERIFDTNEVIVSGGYFIPTASLMLKKEVLEDMPKFLNSAPVGDYYLQILGSLVGGALYIPLVMCVYRVETTGSWSSTIQQHENRQAFRVKTLEMMKQLDQHLNFCFSPAFQLRSNQILLAIANDYLRHGDTEQFEDYLEVASNSPGKKSLKYFVVRSLRKLPRLLRFIYWFWRNLLETKRRIIHVFEPG